MTPADDATQRLARVLTDSREVLLAGARRRTGDPDLAEEVVAEAVERALARGTTWESDEHCLRWLHVTAGNLAVDLHRQRARRGTVDQLETAPVVALASTAPGPEDIAIDRERFAALAAALGELRTTDRDLLVDRGVHGESVTQLGQARAMTVGSVHVALSRARTRLRTGFEARVASVAPALLPWVRRVQAVAPAGPVGGWAVFGVAATIAAVGVGLYAQPSDGQARPTASTTASATEEASIHATGAIPSDGPEQEAPVPAPNDADRAQRPTRSSRPDATVRLPGGGEGTVIIPGSPSREGGRAGAHLALTAAGMTVEGGADTPLPEPFVDDQCIVLDSGSPDPTPGDCPDEPRDAHASVSPEDDQG